MDLRCALAYYINMINEYTTGIITPKTLSIYYIYIYIPIDDPMFNGPKIIDRFGIRAYEFRSNNL